MSEQDQIFFSNFTIVVLILAVMMVVFLVAARFIGGMIDYGDPESKQERLAERLAPVGQVRLEGEAEVTAPVPATAVAQAAPGAAAAGAAGEAGKSVYDGLCFNCHGTGIPGVPQFGDKTAWEARIAKGMETLYANAINGFTGESGMMMPPKGGNTALSDDEVKAAVDYIVSAMQPVATAEAAPAQPAAEAAPAAAEPAAGAATAGAGKSVYDGLCFNCHGTGIPGVPQLGDKAAWAPRIAKGMETLYANAINGFTGAGGMPMPPKGGNAALSDDEVKAAVDYIVSQSQ